MNRPLARPLAVRPGRRPHSPCDLSVTTSPQGTRQLDRSSLACSVHPRHPPPYKLPGSKDAISLTASPGTHSRIPANDVHDCRRRTWARCRLGIEPYSPDICWVVYPRRDRSICDVNLSTPQELPEATPAAVCEHLDGPSSISILLLTLRTGNRMVIRIMLMVPIYAIASLIALFSLEAAFVIDVIRDIYEVWARVWHSFQ